MLEIEKNNSFLLTQESGKFINYIDNKNLQSSSTINSYSDNFNRQLSTGEVNEIRTISNHKDSNPELSIHIPKGSFHPATNRPFNPDEIIINKGQTITWINEEKSPHTITSKGFFLFNSLLKQNEEFTYQFDKAGSFEFGCTLHSLMHETINVI